MSLNLGLFLKTLWTTWLELGLEEPFWGISITTGTCPLMINTRSGSNCNGIKEMILWCLEEQESCNHRVFDRTEGDRISPCNFIFYFTFMSNVLLIWTKLPLSLWRNLIVYGSGIFIILVEFWVSDLGDSRGYFGWKRPNDSKSLLCYEVHRFWAEFNCLGLVIWCFLFLFSICWVSFWFRFGFFCLLGFCGLGFW